ncbi:Co2+/Mg2+ efflux protein ApaG [Martelella soudanensis]|uniref:Co2+/Mg2+ efflux protein ApaG n=1 Tax=unclassified Martelella TaxID=2629616 RepID=UPI001AEE124E|nr:MULTISPECIES: Co2+/Mg2+ efflux protein ApaG [unclassified Martelella]
MAYRAITNDIEVSVGPSFLDGHSMPEDRHFVWAYEIEIVNHRDERIQILSRHWTITNAEGIVETVSGSGVAGKQPMIEAGARYSYQSAAPLDTPSGIMVGHYIIKTADDRLLKIDIPAFSLDSPYEIRSRH